MNFEVTRKEKSTFIAPGVIEREGNYIICPECRHDRSYLLIEDVPGTQIEWRCPNCRKYLGGLLQEDGTLEKIAVALARKWVLVEIDANCEPLLLMASRPDTLEEATRSSLHSASPERFTTSLSFKLEECDGNAGINPQEFRQFRGFA